MHQQSGEFLLCVSTVHPAHADVVPLLLAPLANTQPGCLSCVSVNAGGWLLASAHIVTAIIGAGVLGLPHAMSWLGWVGGVIVLVLFFWITLWSSLLLADMYEVDGVKHPTYRSAVLHILGEPHPLVAWQGGRCGSASSYCVRRHCRVQHSSCRGFASC